MSQKSIEVFCQFVDKLKKNFNSDNTRKIYTKSSFNYEKSSFFSMNSVSVINPKKCEPFL